MTPKGKRQKVIETDPVLAGFGLVTVIEQSVAVLAIDVSSMDEKRMLHRTLIQNPNSEFHSLGLSYRLSS